MRKKNKHLEYTMEEKMPEYIQASLGVSDSSSSIVYSHKYLTKEIGCA